MKNLTGKIAIVTGGARGLGKAMAKRLLQEGVHVVIADCMADQLHQTAAEFCAEGYPAEAYVVNLLYTDQIEQMIEDVVKKHKRLDILVNNAGIQIRKKAVDFTEDDWDKLMGVNLKACYFTSCAAARHMIPQGSGSIVCISSENSVRYTSKRTLYAISKGAVNALVGALGVEWARYGIRINAVAPGFINTEMHRTAVLEGVLDDDELLSVLPNKRLLSDDEIAGAVCYLASEDASGIVGQVLFVDGGCNKNCLPEKKEL